MIDNRRNTGWILVTYSTPLFCHDILMILVATLPYATLMYQYSTDRYPKNAASLTKRYAG